MRDVPNFADLLRDNATADGGGRTALRWPGGSVTWAELDAQADALATALTRLTGQSATALRAGELAGNAAAPPAGPSVAAPREAIGTRIAIALPNLPEYAVAYLGALRAGLVAVPVNPAATSREVRGVLADAGAEVLITTVAGGVALGAGSPVRHTYLVGPDVPKDARPFASLLRPVDTPPGWPGTRPDDLAALLYTSGTDGPARGAMVTHRALLACHAQLVRLDPAPIGPTDTVLLAVPLFHSYGLSLGLGSVVYHGASGALVERFDPIETLDQIVRDGVTVVFGVPAMYAAWSNAGERAAEAFAGVRLAMSGGAPLDPVATARFIGLTGRPIFDAYGLVPAGPVITSTLASPHPKRGSIGRPIPGVGIKLVEVAGDEIAVTGDEIAVTGGVAGSVDPAEDDQDDGSPGTPGTDPGELVVRGGSLFRGYWPDATDGPDAEGWWATGDVAYADAEGDLFLVDRLADVIPMSGFNVYPREIEQVLAAHPAVAEAAVLGAPDQHGGRIVRAFVVPVPDATVTVAELSAHCEANLARFKCPRSIEFVAALPRTVTGRVRKTGLGGSGTLSERGESELLAGRGTDPDSGDHA